MKWGVALVVVMAVLAAPATASAPTLGGLQRQVTALQAQVVALKARVTATEKTGQSLADHITCNYAVSDDNLNSVFHTQNLLAQYVGAIDAQVRNLPANPIGAQPDHPRYDDQGACARIGVTRIR